MAAGVVAVAFVALVVAYLQLGYHADVEAAEPDPDPGRNAERVLSRAVHEAALANQGPDRNAVVAGARSYLDGRIETLEGARVERGTVYRVEYNDTAAGGFAADRCPGGPGRRFGPCTASDGVITQERAGEYHVVAVAFDVTVTTDSGEVELTFVIRAVGGTAEWLWRGYA
ncbi:hypothetical protein BRD00_11135 [Halobacteriales archaeon QS_8_69_26]|nr:MAG: hypothetical protein BRD00_11135 [Halobacteriales archaeon QS_8_69_26]